MPANDQFEFDTLPPALKRKFFSNAERLRMRRALDGPCHTCYGGPDYLPAGGVPWRLHFQNFRRRPIAVSASIRKQRCLDKSLSYYDSYAASSSNSSFTSSFCSSSSPSPTSSRFSSQISRKPASLPLAHYLTTQVDSQSFRSLPPRIQEKFFSPEERAYLHQANRQSVILDAADEAFYRLKEQPCHSCETLHSDTPISQSPTLYFDPSDSEWDTDAAESEDEESDDDDVDVDMDASLYDTIRQLDEDKNLDLTLDQYPHNHVHAVAKVQPRRKPSFRRTMSFTPANGTRKPKPSVSHTKAPSTSQSSTVPSSLTQVAGRNSTSRPPSGQQLMHTSRSSSSSIDPAAQYYQDPEARLKLRVYLASPQKFDEAIEFGFPSLDGKKDNNARTERPERIAEVPPKVQKITGTLFEDEDRAVHGDRRDKTQRKTGRFSTVIKPQGLPASTPKRQSVKSPSGPAQRIPEDREMTLKMTLTRPDLRTDSPSGSPTSAEDPLKLEGLPPADCPHSWDSDSDQRNVMKKMWRKLRKQM